MEDTTHIQTAFLTYIQPGDRVYRGLDTEFRGTGEREEGTVLFRGEFYDDEDQRQSYAVVKYRGVQAPEVVYRGGENNLQPVDATFEQMLGRKAQGSDFRGVEDQTIASLSEKLVITNNRLTEQFGTISQAFRGLSTDMCQGETRFSGLLLEQFSGNTGASVVNS